MRTPRILILSDQPLFGQVIRRFIEEHTRMKVIAIESDHERVQAKVNELCPDIIILGDDVAAAPPWLPGLLQSAPEVRVVRFTLNGNEVQVYDVRQMVARRPQDLVDLLDSMVRTLQDTSEMKDSDA
jgi:DNA-binding NarL/FixJ family response regulator